MKLRADLLRELVPPLDVPGVGVEDGDDVGGGCHHHGAALARPGPAALQEGAGKGNTHLPAAPVKLEGLQQRFDRIFTL